MFAFFAELLVVIYTIVLSKVPVCGHVDVVWFFKRVTSGPLQVAISLLIDDLRFLSEATLSESARVLKKLMRHYMQQCITFEVFFL